MLATEVIEKLQMQVEEFGDGEVTLPDPLESWRYSVGSVTFDPASQKHNLDPDD